MEIAPHFSSYDQTELPSHEIQKLSFTHEVNDKSKQLSSNGFRPYIENFFMTDALTRSSSIMARASKELPNARNSYKSLGTRTSRVASLQERKHLKTQSH